MVIVCDISAWQFWRTPPQLREGWINPGELDAVLPERSDERLALRDVRNNAREAERRIHSRLLGELKGVSLPVHVMVDEASSAHRSACLAVHRIPRHLPLDQTVDLGGGLRVLSPELTVLTRCRPAGVVEIAKAMFEACGIFSLLPSTPRLRLMVDDLVKRRVLEPGLPAQEGVYGYSDENGKLLSFFDRWGDPLPWAPSFDRHGTITDLWRRPPLTSTEELQTVLDGLCNVVGLPESRRALPIVRNGAASPEEVRAYMLLCAPARYGGEAWEAPDLNRRIQYSQEARMLAHRSFAVGDLLWADDKVDLEVQGRAFHADDSGFAVVTGRRAALESMGYTVLEITHEQMRDLSLLDAMLPGLARQSGFETRARTAAFLKRRTELHRELFDKPYDPS